MTKLRSQLSIVLELAAGLLLMIFHCSNEPTGTESRALSGSWHRQQHNEQNKGRKH